MYEPPPRPQPLYGDGLRYRAPWKGGVGFVALLVVMAGVTTGAIGYVAATSQDVPVTLMLLGPLILLAFATVVAVGVMHPLALTAAEGRVGAARWVFGRLWWGENRRADTVRQLLVRRIPGQSQVGTLVADTGEEPPLTLASGVLWELREVADHLAAALSSGRAPPVVVRAESTPPPAFRAEQPANSKVVANAAGGMEVFELNRVSVALEPTPAEYERRLERLRTHGDGALVGRDRQWAECTLELTPLGLAVWHPNLNRRFKWPDLLGVRTRREVVPDHSENNQKKSVWLLEVRLGSGELLWLSGSMVWEADLEWLATRTRLAAGIPTEDAREV